ncbi:hypothetical protein UFOVP49_52 [uncultured Caudovirales phage]|uniref:Uncharacterized protein n=1 Tax=uncultured Caudovirales phage TaxID=2100421 RepID=A0A6J5KQL6_9CAUD|nr:hypothetical protein UFOVP49_52 [uncultured Caudovirales phage]
MNWNLEGLRVVGKYLDTYDVVGRVDLSRVKYGGSVEHHIALDFPIEVYGVDRERVIIDHRDVAKICS